MKTVCLNGRFFPAGQPVLTAANRSYRYGDGLFETLLCRAGEPRLGTYHFERLFTGMELLGMETGKWFTRTKLEADIQELCRRNETYDTARVRLSVFRGEGGLYDEDRGTGYLIESWALEAGAPRWNENGLVIGVYPDARKSTDRFSSLKSANFQPYSLAANYAKQHRLNDALVLNDKERIADSTIANVFLVFGNEIATPPLSEGCVSGVMRRHLLDKLPSLGFKVVERPFYPHELKDATELFLTNAIHGLRWVRECGEAGYECTRTREIYRQLFQPSAAS